MEALYTTSRALFQNGDFQEALELISKKNPDIEDCSLELLRAQCEEALGLLDDAMASVRRAQDLLSRGKIGLRDSGTDQTEVCDVIEKISRARMARDGISKVSVNVIFDKEHASKLKANPTTAPFLEDPAFIQRLIQFQEDPSSLQHFRNDERIMKAVSILLGVDPGNTPMEVFDFQNTQVNQDKEKSIELKSQGDSHYSKGEYSVAVILYKRAMDLDKLDYLSPLNASAALLSSNNAENALEMASVAIKRMSMSSPKAIHYAKAYFRKGDALSKLERYEEALSSLIEAKSRLGTDKDNKSYASTILKLKKEILKIMVAKCEKSIDEVAEGSSPEQEVKILSLEILILEKHGKEGRRASLRLYQRRGNALLRVGRWSDALEDFEGALSGIEDYELYLNTLKAIIKEKKPEFGQKCMNLIHRMRCKRTRGALAVEEKDIDRLENWIHSERLLAVEKDKASEEEEMQRFLQDPELRAIISDMGFMSKIEELNRHPASYHILIRDPETKRRIDKLIQAGIINI